MEPAQTEKLPFDIDVVVSLIREAVRDLPPAVLFQLADEGYGTPFEQLVACIISIRTLDEVTERVARQLFARARTAADFNLLSVEELDELIAESNFHAGKALQIKAIAARVAEEFGGELPCDENLLLSFRGVGPKCTNLVMGIACGVPRVAVDIHVHRVTNRWGYVQAKTPEQTMAALIDKLPERYWIEINRLLIPFGKNICTGRLPWCSRCPVLDYCQQVGVTGHR
ncbi:MAG TPA: endonuclease III [Chloroflexota bacterium]|nr:endonuclease III [Chloroflexota bacterium]